MTEYVQAPAVMAFSDSEEGVDRSRRAVEALGYRMSHIGGVAAAAERIDRQVALDAILIDLGAEPPPDFDRLLDAVQNGARDGRFGSVITAPFELIDRVAARVSHNRIEHLCEPPEADRIIQLARVAAPQADRLHDIGKGAGRLQQLSEEVGRIANILASLSEDEPPEPARLNGGSHAAEPAIDAGFVRAIIRARRLRDQYFKSDLFADPAWDMLLDLMAARLERQRVAVSSLCIAAAVPATTALRWIKTLTDHGLFVRHADPQDGRRVYIELSDKTAASLEAYLRATQRISPLIV